MANDGYKAFDTAHTKMDKIRSETLEIPKKIKSVLTVLFKVSEHWLCFENSTKS